MFFTSKSQNKNNFVFLCCNFFSNLGRFSEINKQFHVKSWLTYRSYRSVWYLFSCMITSPIWRFIIFLIKFHFWFFQGRQSGTVSTWSISGLWKIFGKIIPRRMWMQSGLQSKLLARNGTVLWMVHPGPLQRLIPFSIQPRFRWIGHFFKLLVDILWLYQN